MFTAGIIMPSKASKAGAVNMGFVVCCGGCDWAGFFYQLCSQAMKKQATSVAESKTTAKLLTNGGTLETSSMRRLGKDEIKMHKKADRAANAPKKMKGKRLRGQRGVLVESDDETDDPWLRVALAGGEDIVEGSSAAKKSRGADDAAALVALTASSSLGGSTSGARAASAQRKVAAALAAADEAQGAAASDQEGSGSEDGSDDEAAGDDDGVAAAAAVAFG